MKPGAPALALVAALAVAPAPVDAQLETSGYLLAVGTANNSSPLSGSGQTAASRGRLMLEASAGDFRFDVAYEHIATRRWSGTLFDLTGTGGSTAGVLAPSDWLGTDWRIWQGFEGFPPSPYGEWRHRFDRLQLQWSGGPVEVTVGRQAISWGTALFLTPTDPFLPFSPSDPYRVYRGGVDAIRVQFFPGPFTEIEVVARATETSLPIGATRTILMRGQTSVGGWAIGGWAGELHEEAAAAVFATGSLGSTAIRTEASIRRDPGGGNTIRGTLGFDRYFMVDDRDAVVLAEVQYDGFGFPGLGASTNPPVSAVVARQRGEMQTLGEWTIVTQGSYQLHPLVGVDLLALINAGDRSSLLAPGVSWSATESASVRVGVYVSRGRAGGPPTFAISEYGALPTAGYASLTWFF